MSVELEKVGWALILNNETFDNTYVDKRTGSQCDVKKLINVFNLLDFRMEVVKDPTLQDIHNFMNQLLVEDLSNVLCLVIVVMSHGKQNGIIAARDQWYSIENEILNSKVFKNDKLLKVVITQACKISSNSQTEKKNPTQKGVYKNILCLDSTLEGLQAWRYDDGSPFIDILCRNLSESGHMLNITEIANNTLEEFHTTHRNPQIPLIKNIDFDDLCIGIRARSL